MSQLSTYSELLFPLVALWEWSPVVANVIAIIVLCFILLKWWPGWAQIKNCPRPFIIVPILSLIVIGIPIYGLNKFIAFLTKVSISCNCDPASSTIVMPVDGVINWVDLSEVRAQYGGGGVDKAFGPVGGEMKLFPSLQIVYRCRVVNHGSSPIFKVDMPLHLTLMEAIRDDTNPGSMRTGAMAFVGEWPVPIPEIGGTGGMYVFYISNRSPKFVFITFPEFVTFERANMETKDTTRLKQAPGLKLSFSPIS